MFVIGKNKGKSETIREGVGMDVVRKVTKDTFRRYKIYRKEFYENGRM